MTGFVNAHTHLYSGLFPYGVPAPEPAPTSFPEILERLWWRLDRALDEESLRAAARVYVAHAIAAGTSALIDHHESPEFIEGSLEVVADAAEEFGMPMLVTYGATERNGGRAEARRGLAECERFLTTNQRPRVRGLVGVHAAFTVSDETLVEAADLARRHETVLHLHVAEDAVDVADAKRRGYDGVVDRLLCLNALPEGSILAHGVHLTAAEVRRVDERGGWLVQNPRSNENNGVGYPVALAAASRVALGTDGFPSDGAQEAEALERLAREHGDDPRRAAGRKSASAALFAACFGDEPVSTASPIDDDAMAEIEHEAHRQAARLAKRMEVF